MYKIKVRNIMGTIGMFLIIIPATINWIDLTSTKLNIDIDQYIGILRSIGWVLIIIALILRIKKINF